MHKLRSREAETFTTVSAWLEPIPVVPFP
jgi:hypothetical protein